MVDHRVLKDKKFGTTDGRSPCTARKKYNY